MTYLASAYSHPDSAVRQARFESACRCAAAMILAGYHVISPIAHSHPIAVAGNLEMGWEFWRDLDLAMLSKCDSLTVLVAEGWNESEGVSVEIRAAEWRGMPIRFVREDGTELKEGEI